MKNWQQIDMFTSKNRKTLFDMAKMNFCVKFIRNWYIWISENKVKLYGQEQKFQIWKKETYTCAWFLKIIKVSISHLKLIETEQDFKIRTKFLENVKEKNSEWCMIRYITYIVSTWNMLNFCFYSLMRLLLWLTQRNRDLFHEM